FHSSFFHLCFLLSFPTRRSSDLLSYQESATPAHWICDGSTSYEISEGTRTTRGTDVILHINDDSAEFLNKSRLQDILNKYAKFLDRKSTRLNSSHVKISYAVFCL